MIGQAIYSSASVEWATPPAFFDALDAEFHFTLDVCATPLNAKCAKFYSPVEDGLSMPWSGVCWMNPPYGKCVDKWLAKATAEATRGVTVVALLPSRTCTRWWHKYVEPILAGLVPGEVRFQKGRLKFGGGKQGAPFPSVLIVFAASEDTTRQVPSMVSP